MKDKNRVKRLKAEVEQVRGWRAQNEFLRRIKKILMRYSDRNYRKSVKRFVPGAGKHYGVRIPHLRVISNVLGTDAQTRPGKYFSLLPALWNEGSREEKLLTSGILNRLAEVEPKRCLALTLKLARRIDNWEINDSLGGGVMRVLVREQKKAVLSRLAAMMKNRNPWVRRFGVVSLVGLAHDKNRKHHREILSALNKMMLENDRNVKMGISWILRDSTWQNRQGMYQFLKDWVSKGDRNTHWIIRDGMSKLKPEQQLNLKLAMGKAKLRGAGG